MKLNVTRRVWFVLVVSGAFAFASAWASRRFPPETLLRDAALDALRKEKSALGPQDDAARDALRRQWSEIQRHGWGAAEVTAVEAQLGHEWRCEVRSEPGNAIRSIMCTSAHMPLTEWRRIETAIDWIEHRPAARLARLEVTTEGKASQRRFAVVTFNLRVLWRDERPANDQRGNGSITVTAARDDRDVPPLAPPLPPLAHGLSLSDGAPEKHNQIKR